MKLLGVIARSLARSLALALALPQAHAQATLDLRLAADPARLGPPGLVFARGQIEKITGLATDSGVQTWLAAGATGVRAGRDAGPPLPDGVYLAGTLTTAEGDAVTIACDFAGRETWSGPSDVLTRPGLRRLLDCLDAARPLGTTVWVDVAVLVGNLAVGFETESTRGLLTTLGATECGELVLHAGAGAGGVVLEGRSRGGVLLPLLLLHLAGVGHDLAAVEERRWIALAFAGRDARREEAVLQLARFRSPDSERCLLALLHQADFARTCALAALAGRGESGALPRMAATPAFDAGADAAAAAALATLWSACSPQERRLTLRELARNAELSALVGRLDAPATAGHGAAVLPAQGVLPGGVRALLLACLVPCAVVLAWRALRGPST